jgi:hypothetical protein
MMSPGRAAQFPPGNIKQEHSAYTCQYFHAQAVQGQYVGECFGRDSTFESQIRGLEYRPASSINTTASSGASYASTTMPQKRPSEGENGVPAKHIKAEHPEEFSNAVKKRLQSSSRTGQACDRCKVRLIDLVATQRGQSYTQALTLV